MATANFGPPFHLVEFWAQSEQGTTDGTIGQHGWQTTAIGGAGTPSYQNAASGLPVGFFRNTTSGTTAQGDVFHLGTDDFTFNNKGGYCRFRARYPNITGNTLTGNNFRIGIDDSVTATAPTVGIVVQSLAGVLTLRADSGDNGDVSAAVAGVSTLTSGTTMVLGTWHDFEIVWSGDNGDTDAGPDTVVLYVDGELAAELKGNVLIAADEEAELKITHWDTGAGATLELDVEFYEVYQAR